MGSRDNRFTSSCDPGEIDSREGTRGWWYKLDSGNRVYVTMVFTCEVHFEVNAEDIIVGYQLVGRDCSRM